MLNPGCRGIDYSGFRPTATQVKTDGACFVLRYSAGVGNSDPKCAWKLCGLTEIHAAVAAGLDFIANSEYYATRITEGAAAGAADGAADLAFWKSRGLAKGATIYVSWDAEPDPSKYDAVEAYLKAYKAAMGGYYCTDNPGLYAGTPALVEMLKRGVVSKTWRTNAGSWDDDGLPYQPPTGTTAECMALVAEALKATPANLIQTGNYWYGKNADENVVLRSPVGSHLEALVAPTPSDKRPYYTGYPAALVSHNGDWIMWLGDDGVLYRHYRGTDSGRANLADLQALVQAAKSS